MRSLSKNIQTGKAGEHLVCADLIIKGFNAFLADQGLHFDVVVEKNNKLFRVQVKTVSQISNYSHAVNTYKFTTRGSNMQKGKTGRAKELGECDFYAFVVPSINRIAYMSVKDLVSKNTGKVNQLIEFKTRTIKYKKHPLHKKVYGKFIEDYSEFPINR